MVEPTSTITIAVGGVTLAAEGTAAVILSAGLVVVAVIAVAGLTYYFCKKNPKAGEKLIDKIK